MFSRPILAIAAFVLAAAVAPAATPRVFEDSTLYEGKRFSDEIAGQGPDLIFISGMSSSRETWAEVARQLRSRYRVHLIQLAGYAGEPARDNASGLVIIPSSKEIAAYLEAQKLTPATVIGHSLGGTVALILTEAYQQDIKKVMLVDTLPYWGILYGGPAATPKTLYKVAEAARRAPTKTPMSDRVRKRMAVSPENQKKIEEWVEATNDSAAINSWADDITIDLRPGLKTIHVPVTLVYPDYAPIGEDKAAIVARYTGEFADLKGIKFVQIHDSVHFVMFDQPEQFMQALEDFLKE